MRAISWFLQYFESWYLLPTTGPKRNTNITNNAITSETGSLVSTSAIAMMKLIRVQIQTKPTSTNSQNHLERSWTS